MHFLQKFPNFVLRHKFVHFLCKMGLVANPAEIGFNNCAKAVVDLNDPEPRNVFLKGVFEPDFFSVAQVMLPPNGVYFDLGANFGLCSFGLLPTRPSARYHLFEANALLTKVLERSFALHPETSFTLNKACVTDQSGHTCFHLEADQSGQSHVAIDDEASETVLNLVLDDYCDENNLSLVHFAKLDLEGHELSALRGWKQNLEAKKVRALYLEVMPENQARYGLPTTAALSFLENFGYRLHLCKEQDFGLSDEAPVPLEGPCGSIPTTPFQAKDYPEDHPSDILALAPQ